MRASSVRRALIPVRLDGSLMSLIPALGVSALRLTVYAAADSERCPTPLEGVALTLRDADGGPVVTKRSPTRHKRDRGSPVSKWATRSAARSRRDAAQDRPGDKQDLTACWLAASRTRRSS